MCLGVTLVWLHCGFPRTMKGTCHLLCLWNCRVQLACVITPSVQLQPPPWMAIFFSLSSQRQQWNHFQKGYKFSNSIFRISYDSLCYPFKFLSSFLENWYICTDDVYSMWYFNTCVLVLDSKQVKLMCIFSVSFFRKKIFKRAWWCTSVSPALRRPS